MSTASSALRRIGREADLVVGDHVQRAAGRIPLERIEIQRLGDDALARERRVAVEEDRHRDRRIVLPAAPRAVGLLGARAAFDDGVDRLEVARVGDERDADLAGGGVARAPRAEVVLDVAGAALGIGDDGLERALAFELAQDLLVGQPDRVGEDVQAAPVGHAEHDLARARLRAKLEGLVEHRDRHVEPLERELLLAEERAAEVALGAFHLAEPRVERAFLLAAERGAIAPRLDRLPQPHALLVVGDVLDLVRHRPAVRLLEPRQRLGERLAVDADAQDPGRDARLELGRQLRLEVKRVERRITRRLRAERVETRREMAVHPVRLDERHRGGDAAEELEIALGCFMRRRGRGAVPVASGSVGVARGALEQAGEAGKARHEVAVAALEESAPLRRDGLWDSRGIRRGADARSRRSRRRRRAWACPSFVAAGEFLPLPACGASLALCRASVQRALALARTPAVRPAARGPRARRSPPGLPVDPLKALVPALRTDLRLRLDRPPDDPADVDDRDLQDQQKDDAQPHGS